jgi:hypothetical protein
MTALELITSALRSLGVAATGEAVSSDEATDALARLNEWIDAMGAEGLTVYQRLRTATTLTAATASYTIGTGGVINIARPVQIDRANLVLDTTATTPTEVPITVYTDQQWQSISQKTLTAAQPQGVYYDYGWTSGLGILYPWPIPTVSTTQLVIYTPVALTELATTATTFTGPPGYIRFYRTNLAVELAPEYGITVPDELREAAAESKAAIKRMNFRLTDLAIDPALLPRQAWYDINTDG